MDEFKLVMDENGVVYEYEEPYATIECPTEEDYNHIKAALACYKKYQWISVKDQLPEGDKFFAVNRWGHVGCYQRRTWDPDWTVGGFKIDRDFLYWMPMPEPPKEDKDE